ncbi:MAG TPA: hypothetical protein VKZ51_13000 [Cyclobacteriaceae bacterium]|nr:hypothetical protein [Cyclobacteriaceae bacterium]
MSVLKNPFFILSCVLFWVNQYLEKVRQIFIPFVHSYLDDLLLMPVALGITLQIYRWIHPAKEKFAFTKVQIAVAVIYFSILFEGLLPLWSDLYTRDLLDVVFYSIGAVLFYFLINNRRTVRA